ncbi:MAG: class I adenylate-forming enzyme family protein [Desulfobacterales bacterium]
MTLAELLDLNHRKFGDKVAFIHGEKRITFTGLKDLSEKSAAVFQSMGVGKGSRVSIMSYNTPSFVYAFFGALKAGAAVVPINHKLMAPEVDYIVNHSKSEIFLYDGVLADVASKLESGAKQIAMDSMPGSTGSKTRLLEKMIESAPAYTPVDISAGDTAEILYTSGTTGKPKGCVHSHSNVIMAGITGALTMKMDKNDRLLMAMPIWHSSPLNNWFMGAQYVGASTVLLREYHPVHFLEAVMREKTTVYFGAPISYLAPLQMVSNFDEYDLSSMRCWIYGGGPISAEHARLLISKYKSDNFYQVYGMTESGPTGTTLFPEEQVEKAGSIGKTALPGADLKVMKSDTREAARGETGEIWLKAASMMEGYLDDPDATNDAFHENWYKTGDLVRIDEDGYMFIIDRTKDMIVTGGENVYSKEVEDALTAHPGISDAAVIGRPHPEWGETVTAYYIPAQDEAPSIDEIKDFLARRLAKYKIPREFHKKEELPRTPTGKVMKYVLREK